MALIEAKQLSFCYKTGESSVPVLRGIDLRVEEGDFLAIQGASGSGKSTLLYILGCLLRPDSGTLKLDGREITSLDRTEMARVRNKTIGFVFQQFHLLPRANILENILLPAHYPAEEAVILPEHRERAIGLARQLGVDGQLRHLPNQLSGGQQQRVAIARALMNDSRIILADEPTGNLDSKNAAMILDLLKDLNRQGRTIVLITHDPEVARQCSRIYHMRDGLFTEVEELRPRRTAEPVQNFATRNFASEGSSGAGGPHKHFRPLAAYLKLGIASLPLAWENVRRNRARSLLTMLGITIGVAAVLAMITLGQFTKNRILESYETLGVNKLAIRGWPNWNLKASDKVGTFFRFFNWERDLLPMSATFSDEIRLMSPVLDSWNATANYAGKTISKELQIFGVSPDYLHITNRQLIAGRNMNPFHVANKAGVCIIGFDIAQRLLTGVAPVGQILYVQDGNSNYACTVIGVMKSQTTNSTWQKPNLQILVPYTFFQAIASDWWTAQIDQAVLQLHSRSDVEKTSKMVKAYFIQKYGKSGRFSVDSDGVLVAQMKKFLNLFAVMLASIAVISLLVGGIGITNMMLVSVSERFKELGLRKAVGATDFSIRVQLLVESVLLCGIAGLAGIILGFSTYEALIFGASKLVSKLQFEWVVEPGAVILSVISILVVGISSGLAPAIKAEKLEVIEALRSE